MKIIIQLFQIQKSISENHKRNLKPKVEFPKYFKSYAKRFSTLELLILFNLEGKVFISRFPTDTLIQYLKS